MNSKFLADYAGSSGYEATERILKLLQLLLANECKRQMIFEKLAREYHLDDIAQAPLPTPSANRMLARDFQFLERLGFEIIKRQEGREKLYRVVQGNNAPTVFLFTPSEVESLARLYNLLVEKEPGSNSAPPRNPFGSQMLSLLEKLIATLPTEQARQFKRLTLNPSIHFSLPTAVDYLPYQATIDTLEKACNQRQQISFEYLPSHRDKEKIEHKIVDPYKIEYMDGHFYLLGYNHKLNFKGEPIGFLEYRVDRIVAESIKILPDVMDGKRARPLIEFSYWLHDNSARRGVSMRWAWQRVEREETYLDERGQTKHRVLVQARDYTTWRIIQKLLKYGEQAELVAGPPALIEQMRQTVQKMYNRYYP